jgi:hypothetical protein
MSKQEYTLEELLRARKLTAANIAVDFEEVYGAKAKTYQVPIGLTLNV